MEVAKTGRGPNPGGGEIFLSRPDRSWKPYSLLYNEYLVYSPGVKRSRRVADHPPSSSAEVKEKVEQYLWALMIFFRVNLPRWR